MKITNYIKTIFISSIILFFSPTTLGQSSTVKNLSTAACLAAISYGYDCRTYYEYGVLKQGQYFTYKKTLYQGNRYAFIGLGDNNTKDLDIFLYDVNHNLKAQDKTAKEAAAIEFYAPYTGIYYVRVKMYATYTTNSSYWILRTAYK